MNQVPNLLYKNINIKINIKFNRFKIMVGSAED